MTENKGLMELAADSLTEGDDWKFYGWRVNPTSMIVNNISYTYDSKKMKVGYFRFTDKCIFGLKIDEKQLPFATVEKKH